MALQKEQAMKWFAVFDPATGLIKRSGSIAPEDVQNQAMPGEAVVEVSGPVDAMNQRIVDGQVVAYQPPKPEVTTLKDWEWSGRRWVAVLTLEGIRESAVATLRARIRSLEENTDRALRQLVIETEGHPGAARMQAIEDAVDPLRLAINAALIAESKEALAAILGSVS